MEINIIVAKKLRDEHYVRFLECLNRISAGFDIFLYCTSCQDAFPYTDKYFDKYEKFKVRHDLLEMGEFNKSKLLNHSLSVMRKTSNIICVMDIDMIYCLEFFKKIKDLFSKGADYIVSYGKKLQENGDFVVFKGCSQISIKKKTLELFNNLFGFFYNEYYSGWGGEDSDISFKSRILNQKGIIKKVVLFDVWKHLWHEESRPENYKKTRNSLYFQNSKDEIKRIICTKI